MSYSRPTSAPAHADRLSDASSIEWPSSVVSLRDTLWPAPTCSVVTAAAGLPVAQQGTWTVALSGSAAVTGTFWQATQPVSGTLTVNAGTNLNTSALALETGGDLAAIAGKTPRWARPWRPPRLPSCSPRSSSRRSPRSPRWG